MFYSSGSQFGAGLMYNSGSSPLYPNPFADYASTVMPNKMPDILDMCRFVFHANSPVREAARRLLSYFITDLVVRPVDARRPGGNEAEEIKKYCEQVLNYRTLSEEIGLDFFAEGNSFISVIPPFRRYVACKKCHFSLPVKEFIAEPKYKFRWQAPHFHGKCSCGYSGPWKRSEVALRDSSRIFVKRWSTIEMKIRTSPNVRRKVYIWEIPGDYRVSVRRGDQLVLEEEPWEFVEAALANRNFIFDEDAIFHLAEVTSASVKAGGWGLPRSFVNFRHVWYWHLLHRMVEAVGADYLLPLRTITPAMKRAGDDEDDPLMQIDAMGLRAEVEYALRRRRIDPAQWAFLGQPVESDMIGADATKLIPSELLDQATANLLNSYGYPIEFWKGSLQTQTAIPAIRMMQAANAPMVKKLALALTWVLGKVSEITGWEKVLVDFKPPTLVDDIQSAMARMQATFQGMASESTGLGGLGLDFRDEYSQKIDDEVFKVQEQKRLEEAGQSQELIAQLNAPPVQDPNQAQGGAAPGGAQGGQDPSQGGQPPAQGGDPAAGGMNMMAMPSGPGPGQKVSLEQLQADGNAIAQQLMTQPSGIRQGYLTRLKQRQPALHAQVRSALDSINYQLKSQGGQMLQQQVYGAAA